MHLPQLVRGIRSRGRWAGGLLSLLTLVALAVLVWRAGWEELVQPLAQAEFGWIAGAVILALAVEVVKAVRWQLLLGTGRATLPGLVAVVFTARLLNVLAPLRAGDVWRVTAARGAGAPLVAVGSSILAEKLLDSLALGIASAILLWSVSPDLLLG